MIDESFAQNLIETAINCGAEKAEAYISEKTETEITIAEGKPESVNVKSDQGYGIRVLLDSKLGFYSSNRLEPLLATENIRQLVRATGLHTSDPFNTLPEHLADQSSDASEIYDPELAQIPLSEKIKTAIEIEKAGRGADSRVAGFVWILYGDVTESYRIISSTGIDVSSSGTTCYGFAYCFANHGEAVQTGRFAKAYGRYSDFNAGEIGRTAADYAVRMLGARDLRGSNMQAVFPPEAGIPIVHALFGMIEADSVQKGKSPFREKIGKQVASDILTLIDDGTLADGLGTRPYDSEGIPTTRTMVIENGLLKNYLYDTYTAKKGKTKSTGNAARSSYHSKPLIFPTNFFIKPTDIDTNEMIGDVEKGILITELSGLHAG
ncbi:MAG TPA: TldD/PmbA family protein, partial [candidate division Zixibacteria bacterium]|nr:TldD/PmbA family protein [candidate division Zixibacteria bacterium]